MTAGGNKFELTYDGDSFLFDSVRLEYGAHIEETPLLNGGLYRVRAASGRNNMRLKGRFVLERLGDYAALITAFSTGTRSFTLNDDAFTGWTLLSAKLASEEKEQFAVCELVLAEVSV